MSSTNRSDARDLHRGDYYITPIPAIIDFLEEFQKELDIDWSEEYIFDPCAGGDRLNPMSYPQAIIQHVRKTKPNFSGYDNIGTLDIRKDSPANLKGDYLEFKWLDVDNKPYVIITNPPFCLAQPIIEKALQDVKDGGWVIMLLRLNFFGSVGRKKFFEKYMPSYCYIHRKRMSFSADGKTDSIEYAHFVWWKGENPEFCNTKII